MPDSSVESVDACAHAVEAAYQQHGRMVYNTCLRILGNPQSAEDATQAVFLLLVKKALHVRTDRDLGGWLYCVAELVSKKGRTAEQRLRRREQETRTMNSNERSAPGDAELSAAWDDIRPRLDAALASLPEKYRTPLIRVHLEGHPQRSVAQELGLNEGTLRWRLSHALERLRQKLGVDPRTSATLMLLLLERFASAATPPPTLLSSILTGAHAVSMSGKAALQSPHVAQLFKGGMKTMFWGKVKLSSTVAAIALLLAAPVALRLTHAAQPVVIQVSPRQTAGDQTGGPQTPPAADAADAADRETARKRKIAKNNYLAMRTCTQIMEAQEIYRRMDYAGTGIAQYAVSLLGGKSAPPVSLPAVDGRDAVTLDMRNGLLCVVLADGSEKQSHLIHEGVAKSERPFGVKKSAGEADAGYFYRVLTAHSARAEGGAGSYLKNGALTEGYAVLAYPAEYGKSGTHVFIISSRGLQYSRDFGDIAKTEEYVASCTAFDPGPEWKKTTADQFPDPGGPSEFEMRMYEASLNDTQRKLLNDYIDVMWDLAHIEPQRFDRFKTRADMRAMLIERELDFTAPGEHDASFNILPALIKDLREDVQKSKLKRAAEPAATGEF